MHTYRVQISASVHTYRGLTSITTEQSVSWDQNHVFRDRKPVFWTFKNTKRSVTPIFNKITETLRLCAMHTVHLSRNSCLWDLKTSTFHVDRYRDICQKHFSHVTTPGFRFTCETDQSGSPTHKSVGEPD